ncbi:hypothetical protein GCM10009678_36890 [Actinomadura kijaniata]|uniref:C2H2-type domain-containing protein n=1 Tax=Actinomadura namibiensis TaxID=182080 RepID=A0A7W3QRU0_ACTNM|nr:MULTISPECIES: hypothetical protein [Actinomadura]MBA8957145.1 hypothetical protein [Actinomadura namibiensis]
MRNAWSDHEVWIYECLRCGATWEEGFDVRHVDDGHGGEAVAYAHGGHPCTTPWTDHPCCECHSGNVKAFSAPWRKSGRVPEQRPDSGLETVIHLRRIHAW